MELIEAKLYLNILFHMLPEHYTKLAKVQVYLPTNVYGTDTCEISLPANLLLNGLASP